MTNSRKARIRRQRQRRALLTMALVLVTAFACIGGTIAWLTATSGEVTNTFTVGDINIELMEHEVGENGALTETETTTETYKIIPGTNLNKDPFVTVKGGSEACWLFVKVEEANWPDYKNGDVRKINYAIDTTVWTPLDGQTGVYYRSVSASEDDQVFNVLKDMQVTVSDTLTKDEVGQINENGFTLKFTAYAVQSENVGSAADAWAKL